MMDSRQFDLEHLESLPPKLTVENARGHPPDQGRVSRAPVVQKPRDLHVLDHGVRTNEGYRTYVEGSTTA